MPKRLEQIPLERAWNKMHIKAQQCALMCATAKIVAKKVGAMVVDIMLLCVSHEVT